MPMLNRHNDARTPPAIIRIAAFGAKGALVNVNYTIDAGSGLVPHLSSLHVRVGGREPFAVHSKDNRKDAK